MNSTLFCSIVLLINVLIVFACVMTSIQTCVQRQSKPFSMVIDFDFSYFDFFPTFPLIIKLTEKTAKELYADYKSGGKLVALLIDVRGNKDQSHTKIKSVKFYKVHGKKRKLIDFDSDNQSII